jgi:hypothetical protein
VVEYGGGRALRVVPRAGGGSGTEGREDWKLFILFDSRCTVIQPGSSVAAQGFEGRAGLGIAPFSGGVILERAGCPFSSHHFLLSELAGGRPGSMES